MLGPGTRLGPYQVVAALGAGGMGEVYKARDTRLGRTVAVKVLPPDAASDPDRRRRFESEARAASALNHPNICVLHDVGREVPSAPDGGRKAGGGPEEAAREPIDFLVMELLEGQTLAHRLRKGPLPLDQALDLGAQIADALAAAHRQGIVHRDLKPGNIMLTKAGAVRQGSPQVKLLDFGLAKLRPQTAAAGAGLSALSTQEPATTPGAVMGTVPYMAPEQLEGKDTDARTDLFAFGAVLYEMLTGRRAFAGDTEASVISAIMTGQPPSLSALQPVTPPALERLVNACLAKDPDARRESARDLANELRWIGESTRSVAGAVARPRGRQTRRSAMVVAGLLTAAVAGAGVMWLLRPTPLRPSPARLSLEIGPAEEVSAGGYIPPPWTPTPGGSRTALTWTPDGRALVFVGKQDGAQRLYVRHLDAAEARPLKDTDGAQAPAVSADGQWVAFWANSAIKKVRMEGGPVEEVAAKIGIPPWGLCWDERGYLFFGRDDGRIWTIAPGKSPTVVTKLGDGELAHTLPSTLPGAKAIIYTVRKRDFSWGDEEIFAQTLATGTRTLLMKDAADPRYVDTGLLVFMRLGDLFAVPFDAERLQVGGTAVAVHGGVVQALSAAGDADITGAGQFAISTTGALAWVPGPVVPFPVRGLAAVDRRGQVSPLRVREEMSYGMPLRVSPDGRQLAVAVHNISSVALVTIDLDSGTSSLLSRDGELTWPVWSRDGQRLTFSQVTGGRRSLATQPASGATPPQTLVSGTFCPSASTPGGQVVCVDALKLDILMATIENGRARMEPLIQTPAIEGWPDLSPDGRWLAYASWVSGRREVYVRPYQGPGEPQKVSRESGTSPAWNPNGRELFFLSRANQATNKRSMMAVDFAPGPPPRFGSPHQIFEFDQVDLSFNCDPARCYDVSRDGQRFYVVQRRPIPPPPAVTHIDIIQNWVHEVKAKLAGK